MDSRDLSKGIGRIKNEGYSKYSMSKKIKISFGWIKWQFLRQAYSLYSSLAYLTPNSGKNEDQLLNQNGKRQQFVEETKFLAFDTNRRKMPTIAFVSIQEIPVRNKTLWIHTIS